MHGVSLIFPLACDGLLLERDTKRRENEISMIVIVRGRDRGTMPCADF